jgi:hypothetical protein
VLSEEDGSQIVEAVLKRGKQSVTAPRVMCGCMVVPGQLLSALSTSLQPLVQKRAQEAVTSGRLAQSDAENRIQAMGGKAQVDKDDDNTGSKGDKREERRKKAAGGKAGGGAQVRIRLFI